ncbi:RagB/SusD family nutrient uptake outer membrane protein [Alcaligenes nematophilus]|uniref:RagB/SusD family nutrient uptake outer membrane protein n=1 Tax=Alcaligenes nematophilus TaxID=2994643 RepID=UPI003D1A15AD
MRTKLFLIIFISVSLYSCSDFLDSKPNRSLAIPDNVKDLQALLDYEDRMNLYYPAAGDIAADFYFLTEDEWKSRRLDARETYIWEANAQYNEDWSLGYERIFFANVVLDEIDHAKLGANTENDRRSIKGQAYFFRGFTFYYLAQLFCPYYSVGSEDNEYGLPLKQSADINEAVVRSSLKETYAQIIDDLKQSAALLPINQVTVLRPTKPAAYAALARIYLTVKDYQKALAYADSCLAIQSDLIDYNTVDATLALPFPVLNQEVLFHAIISTSAAVHNQARAFVTPSNVEMYTENDLRSSVFLSKDADEGYRFKGSYSGSQNSLFGGIALDEVYLIKAESEARLGLEDEARSTLKMLLEKRWKDGEYQLPATATNRDLINLILKEREKTLLFRGGLRWSDLRRLNTEQETARTIERRLHEPVYLPPNDLR